MILRLSHPQPSRLPVVRKVAMLLVLPLDLPPTEQGAVEVNDERVILRSKQRRDFHPVGKEHVVARENDLVVQFDGRERVETAKEEVDGLAGEQLRAGEKGAIRP